jgi:hypothetical protein
MNEKHDVATSEPEKQSVPTTRAKEPNVELTPKAQAKVANKLPRAEQLNKFEKDLEAHDPGNQPA